MKSWSEVLDGYAREASGEMPRSLSRGRGCWRVSDGRESLSPVRLIGRNGDHRTMIKNTVA
jgi:hypothetical protein